MSRRQLFFPLSFDDIPEVAVAIGRHDPYLHTGVIYRSSANELRMLDLRMHLRIGNSRPTRNFAWAVPNIPIEEARQIAGLCERIAETRPHVHYGFHYAPSVFSVKDGSLQLGDNMIGLTCATFVLALFHSFNIRLVLEETWKPRESDAQWQEEILEWMARDGTRERLGIDDKYLQGNAKDIGCLRYRPEEVAGACLMDDIPVDFALAERIGKKVVKLADELRATFDRLESQIHTND